MKHYTLEEWVDFANKGLSKELRAAMQSHIDEGCEECSKLAMLWGRVREAAKREKSVEVPESAVRNTLGAFAVANLQKDQPRAFEIARLIFDSLWQPALAGVRASSAVPRQMLYEADNVIIDMRMEINRNSERIYLEGQVMDSATKGKGLDRVPVQVMSGRNKMAGTNTNKFGEFHLECEAAKDLQVAVGVSEKKDIFIPLDETVWKSSK